MRKVLSGYVGYFNARHRRVGHLFQNRYKSILCQEDVYLRELVRYIHLNPIRSRILRTPTELKNHPFCGHKALLGKNGLCNQETEEVLAYFGRTEYDAQISYLEFIKSGWDIKHKKEYTGGGLLKSAGGQAGLRELKKSKEKWQSDYRILGDGDFVKSCLAECDIKEDEKTIYQSKYTLETLIKLICEIYGLEETELLSGRRLRSLTPSKGLLVYFSSEYLDKTLKEISDILKISSSSAVYRLKEKGEEEFKKRKKLF